MRDQVVNHQMMLSAEVNMAIAYFALPLGWGLFFFRVSRHLRSCVTEFMRRGTVPLGGDPGVSE
jgi:TRAP-type C4-dicarboxylate transport system permease small subunit